MQLIIAEKPSVANAIAQVLNVSDRKDGYLEGNGFVISWCYGHLAGLADAEHYDPKYSKWKKEDLPIFPQSFQFKITATIRHDYFQNKAISLLECFVISVKTAQKILSIT